MSCFLKRAVAVDLSSLLCSVTNVQVCLLRVVLFEYTQS